MIHGGCSRRTRLLEDQLVLALEVGKLLTEVTRGRHVPSFGDFRDQGASARPALGACATRPGHAVNMLTEERLCRRHPVAKRSSRAAPHGSTRHSAGCSARASELSNLACRFRPSRTVVG
eukprot:scaffold115077_cov55-Phaeocystis_antarctica.AAC.1